MLRRAGFIAALLMLLTTASVAADSTITITTFAYPPTTSVNLGGKVDWDNHHFTTHSSTSNSPLKLWTFDIGPGTDHARAFKQAGAFPYHCRFHPDEMHGIIKVPMKAQPTSGSNSTVFTISAGTVNAPAGFVYVIQRKAPGAGSFSTWKTTAAKSVSFMSSMDGTWKFRSKLRRTSDGASTGYSPQLSITIN